MLAGEVSPGLRMQLRDRVLSVTHSPEIMEPSELRPFPKPELALSEALHYLAEDDWYVSNVIFLFFIFIDFVMQSAIRMDVLPELLA